MIDDTMWNTIKSFFLEILSWCQSTILFNLTVNNVSVRLSIFDFMIAVIAFDLIVGVVWAVLHRGDSDD